MRVVNGATVAGRAVDWYLAGPMSTPSLDVLFRPRSVAVVGASRERGSIGRELLQNLLAFDFQGPVYPVNPGARAIHGIRCWPSVSEIPDPVDLAVIVVPRQKVLDIVRDCARKGVKGLVIITAGFREVGGEGAELEAELAALVRGSGMRMVGPNCMGIINTDPEIRLDASFAATLPLPGNVAFASQSGALGEAILATARNLGLGLSQFVSLGNKTDVSGNDLLAWWADDPRTRVVLLYLESFGNPRNFAHLARRVTRAGKPILAVKAGRTGPGARAASSHTGSLAGLDAAASSLLGQCGVIRADKVEELFSMAMAFAHQPVPKGSRVAILTNAGGPGIMATDALVTYGLDMAELRPETREAMAAVLAPEASTANPVDMIASADGPKYRACAEALLADPGVDALIVVFVSPAVIDARTVADGIVEGIAAGRARGGEGKPVLTCFMGRAYGAEAELRLREAGVPVYPFPEAAAQALAAMVRFRRWLDRPEGRLPELDVDREAAARLIAGVRSAGREWLTTAEAEALLRAYGLPVAASRIVSSPEEAVAFAEEHGYPVVLKVEAEGLLHKSDVGGVQVDLRNPREIKGAFWDIAHGFGARGIPYRHRVQRMVRGGREVILGVASDPTFGHLLAFGLGGIYVELMRDVVFRLLPITDQDAREMVREIKGWPLLAGLRGEAPVDVVALEDALLRLSRLVMDFPEIAEMDLNPFMAHPEPGASAVVDCRVRLAPPPEGAS